MAVVIVNLDLFPLLILSLTNVLILITAIPKASRRVPEGIGKGSSTKGLKS